MYIVSVCGMGFGTSLILLMNIKKVAKKHGFVIDGEACDLGSAKGKKCDLYVMANDIKESFEASDIPVISIGTITNLTEIEEKVLPKIQEFHSK